MMQGFRGQRLQSLPPEVRGGTYALLGAYVALVAEEVKRLQASNAAIYGKLLAVEAEARVWSLKVEALEAARSVGHERELFTIREVAHMLALSERAVEDLVAKGILRSAVAPGTERARRISRAMIRDYIEEFDSQNPPQPRARRRRPSRP